MHKANFPSSDQAHIGVTLEFVNVLIVHLCMKGSMPNQPKFLYLALDC